jgi:hypothetical protein
MFEIYGVERSQRRVLVATPKNAREALTHYRAAQNLFVGVVIQPPEGGEIDGFELSRRAEREAQQTFE